MNKPNRKTLKLRLERAGYAHVSGWVTVENAEQIMRQIEQAKPEIDTLAAQPPNPSGRPKKTAD